MHAPNSIALQSAALLNLSKATKSQLLKVQQWAFSLGAKQAKCNQEKKSMLRIALHNRVQHYRDLSKATKSQLLNLKVVAPFPGDSPQRSNKCKMQLIGKSCSELHCITECSIVGFKQSRQVNY